MPHGLSPGAKILLYDLYSGSPSAIPLSHWHHPADTSSDAEEDGGGTSNVPEQKEKHQGGSSQCCSCCSSLHLKKDFRQMRGMGWHHVGKRVYLLGREVMPQLAGLLSAEL